MEFNKSAKNASISLRTANQADIEFLKELRRASMWQVVTNHYPWIEEDQLERVMVDFECAQIICTDDQDVGMLKVVYGSKQAQLCQIQLLPEYRGRGIGSMLIAKLQEESSASGIFISLNVFRSNPAIKLYKRLGFNIDSKNDNMFTMVWHPNKSITNQ